MPLTDTDLDLVEVVIACCDGQMGRNAAREIISELDLAGFEIVRKVVDEQRTPNKLTPEHAAAYHGDVDGDAEL